MRRPLLFFVVFCLVAQAATDDDLDDEVTATQDCAVVSGRPLKVATTADSLVLQDKGKTIAEANLPEEFNDAKSSVECRTGVVEVSSQAGFSCLANTLRFTFTEGKLKLAKQTAEDPCRESMQQAEAALKKGDALAAAKEAESILYPDHYVDPSFEEALLEVGRRQAQVFHQKNDKQSAAKVATAVSSWAQNAFARCLGKEDTERACHLKKATAIGDYNDLAFFLDEAGQHAAAEAMLREVVSADPQRAVALLNLADALWEQGGAKQKEAKETYQRYGQLLPAAKWPPRVKARVG